MEGSRPREVVLEIEHTKVIRRRARTELGHCPGCGRTTDFIAVTAGAALFSTTIESLLDFAQTQVCNFRVEADGKISLCLTDLLAAMSKRLRRGKVKLLGETNL